jgi:hypothetical protein
LRRSSILDLVKLHQSLSNSLSGPKPDYTRLIDYLAYVQTRGLGSDRLILALENRVPFDQLDIELSIKDSNLVKKRIDLLASNNTAYRIAMTSNPTALELEQFSFISPCWSLLFPVVVFLIQHPEQAKTYRGFFPFGNEVIKFFHEAKLGIEIKGSPNAADHVRLRIAINHIADHTGMTTVMVANEMYLEGSRINQSGAIPATISESEDQ